MSGREAMLRCRCTVALLVGLAWAACAPRHDPASHLTIWASMEPAAQKLVLEHLAQFETDNPDLTLEITFLDTEQTRNQYQMAALSKAGPDLVYGPSDQVGPFSIMGLIQPLETILPADSLALYVDSAKPSLEGHVYALADHVGNHLTLGYNRALVDRAPQTTREWIELAKDRTVDLDGDGRVDQYGIVLDLLEPFWLVPWLGAYGGWVMDEQTLEPTLDSPAMRSALDFFLTLLREGVVPPGCDYQLAETLFKEGSAAFIVNGPWAWQSYRDAGIDVGLGVLPPVDGGGYPSPMTACKAYSMNAFVPEVRREAVLRLLDYLTSARVVGHIATELGTLPSRFDVGQWPQVATNANVQASFAQLEKGRLMPVVPEMRVIWDVLRSAYQQVQGGMMTVSDALPWMQEQAVRKIEDMRL